MPFALLRGPLRSGCLILATFSSLAVLGANVLADELAEPVFMRVRRNNQKTPIALETAVTRFEGQGARAGVVVDLISVVHIGERDYYAELNKRFKDYDAVLYELVAAANVRPAALPEGQTSKTGGHPVTALQKTMQNMMGLDFQLERVDYQAANFVHADMTPEEMAKSMSDRNESWLQMFFRALGQGLAKQGGAQSGNDMQLLFAFFAKDRALKFKRIAAEQFEDMDGAMAAINGPDGSTLITERNKKALQVLDRELKAGKKRVAIFYGAGHMPDMAQRLETEFQLQRKGEQWLTAWSMAGKP